MRKMNMDQARNNTEDQELVDRSGKHGTKEWAEKNVNCCTGCPNNCKYCYARNIALRFKTISHYDEWEKMVIRDHCRFPLSTT